MLRLRGRQMSMTAPDPYNPYIFHVLHISHAPYIFHIPHIFKFFTF